MRVGMALLAFIAVAPAGEARDTSGMPRWRGVDLLKLVDPKQDRVAGEWAFDGKTLVSPPLAFGRITVPYVPPEEYDLRVVAERVGSGNSLSAGLVGGGRQFLVILDGMVPEAKSGLDLVDGRAFYDNATTHRGQLLADGQTRTILISVRRNRVQVSVDGRRVVDWKADFARVSLWPSWTMPRADTLFLGAWTSPQRVHRLELTPVSGPGKPLR
jgi:hypothetical protein